MVELTDAEALPGGLATARRRHATCSGRCPAASSPSNSTGRPPTATPPSPRPSLQASLRRVSGADVTITAVHSATRFTDNARQATTYRQGRVLLAGDAAHVHSPFGGQGLNLGIGDAVNLGWKLAAVVQRLGADGPARHLHHRAAPDRGVGAGVDQGAGRADAAGRADRRAARGRHRPAGHHGRHHVLLKKIAGVGHRYDLGGEHPLVGRGAPTSPWPTAPASASTCHDGRALLLDLPTTPNCANERQAGPTASRC